MAAAFDAAVAQPDHGRGAVAGGQGKVADAQPFHRHRPPRGRDACTGGETGDREPKHVHLDDIGRGHHVLHARLGYGIDESSVADAAQSPGSEFRSKLSRLVWPPSIEKYAGTPLCSSSVPSAE